MDFSVVRSRFAKVAKDALKHPSLLIVLLVTFIMGCLTMEEKLPDSNAFMVGIFAVAVVCLDRFTPNMKLMPSLLLAVLFPVVCFIPGVEDFVDHPGFLVIHVGILPFAYLCIRRKDQDKPFVQALARSVVSGIFALAISGILCALGEAIIQSVLYLFDLENTFVVKLAYQIPMFVMVVIFPSLFVAMDEGEDEMPLKNIPQILLNWTISPAILIYTVVLYLYGLSIVLKWSLPRGGVAAMVLAYGILSVLAKAHQLVQDKKPFAWFYRYSQWIAVPILILFWVGVVRRISDYGFTTPRYYLVISGIVLSVLSLIGTKPTTKVYYRTCVCIIAATVFSLICPGLNHRAVSFASQRHIVRSLSEKIGILNEDGRFKTDMESLLTESNIDDYRQVYQSLKAIEQMDKDAPSAFGIDKAVYMMEIIPENLRSNGADGIDYPNNDYLWLSSEGLVYDTSGYARVEIVPYEDQEALERAGISSFSDMLQVQAEKCGWDGSLAHAADFFQSHRHQMLTIETDVAVYIPGAVNITISYKRNTVSWVEEYNNAVILWKKTLDK